MWNLPVVANHRKTGEVGTMTAIRFDHHGEPVKVLAIEERPVPEPVDGEVGVRILASPVNPSDLLYVRGHYAGVQAQLPGALHTVRSGARPDQAAKTLAVIIAPADKA